MEKDTLVNIQQYILSELKKNNISKQDAIRFLLESREGKICSLDLNNDRPIKGQPSSKQERNLSPGKDDASVLSHEEIEYLCPQWQVDAPLAAGSFVPKHWSVLFCQTGLSELVSSEWEKGLGDALLACQGGNGPETIHVETLSGKASNLAQSISKVIEAVFLKIQVQSRVHTQEPALLQLLVASTEPFEQLLQAASGLLATAQAENATFITQLILIDPAEDLENLSAILSREANALNKDDKKTNAIVIRYNGSERSTRIWQPSHTEITLKRSVWLTDGVYLITGGLGGLGIVVASAIAAEASGARVILAGRSALSKFTEEKLARLRGEGLQVEYVRTDVADRDSVNDLMAHIKSRYEYLTGVFHCAGLIRDSLIINKSVDDLRSVLAPKVSGVINLDEASADFDLNYFICFSSAAILGNPGQADYAAANAFLDAYSHYRQSLVFTGQRRGKSISFNWPFWSQGGMEMSPLSQQAMLRRGITALPTDLGLQAMYQGMLSTDNQRLVVCRDSKSDKTSPKLTTSSNSEIVSAQKCEHLKELILQKLLYIFSQVLKFPVNRISVHEPLSSYGLDSIIIVNVNEMLAPAFGELSKTLLYEYDSIAALNKYLIDEYSSECTAWVGLEKSSDANANETEILQVSQRDQYSEKPLARPTNEKDDIAIIGLAGRYPGADNLQAYWELLLAGKESITEIPSERWPLHDFYEDDVEKAVKEGKSYSKWGGFLNNFANFDPLFFGISPREARTIDPQERLFLTSCWEVLEDAGYTSESLNHQYGGRVGVFAGITKTGFSLHAPGLWAQGKEEFPHTSFSSVANRVSYLLNFNGPSMPIDTMCSASLTAIHEACEHLKRDECELAIAGGVNLYLHPSNYVQMCAYRMLSRDGHCKSFGAGGNGFVPGEGVGTVLLKSLSKAESEGDHIYGIIKSTAINHGGKTSGYSVPNPKAQAAVISRALAKAGVDARLISYVEAHGTGTALGDPIEISGLSKAYAEHGESNAANYCSLGSVKTNIGHLEAAAGIAGLTKILLQMKHKKLVPSLHSEKLNPNINFSGTPFFVQRELSAWTKPQLSVDGKIIEHPRMAGLSSFGAGGSNAHIILQEYSATSPSDNRACVYPYIILLSAKTSEQLSEQAKNLLTYIESHTIDHSDLLNISYTLQVGREAMEERAGTRVDNVESLKIRLRALVNEPNNFDSLDWTRASVNKNKEDLSAFIEDDEFNETLEKWLARGKYQKVLDLWAKGLRFDWQILYANGPQPRRISLPTYPFAQERYWLDASMGIEKVSSAPSQLHPLLHENTSTGFNTQFTSRFTGTEFFFVDHQIRGQKILPGTAHLEMARVALEKTLELPPGQAIALKDIVWLRPIVFTDDKTLVVHISLNLLSENEAEYDIYSLNDEGDELLYSRGRGEVLPLRELQRVNVSELQKECNEVHYSSETVYKIFADAGFAYGPGHQGIVKLQAGHGATKQKQALSQLVLHGDKGAFGLHPGLLDSVLQSTIGLSLSDAGEATSQPETALPFTLSALKIYRVLPYAAHAWVRYSEGSSENDKVQKLDICVCDANGQVCLDFEGYSSRVMSKVMIEKSLEDTTLIFTPYWQREKFTATNDILFDHSILLVGEFNQQDQSDLQEVLPAEVQCEYLGIDNLDLGESYTLIAEKVFNKIKHYLKNMHHISRLVQVVIQGRESGELNCLSGLSGLLKTAHHENPSLRVQCIEVTRSLLASDLASILISEARDTSNQEIRFEVDDSGKKIRQVKRWREIGLDATASLPFWHDEGVYIITGGAGGLGLRIAKSIMQQCADTKLILTGRSALSEVKASEIASLQENRNELIYRSADVCDRKEVDELMSYIKRTYGKLTGIIHNAGTIKDNFILKKSTEEFTDVLAPKVGGLVNLDEASSAFKLEYFVCFSSLSGSFGNAGQADYAAANGFMDQFVKIRNERVQKGERNGQTISINWPLWAEGGMEMNSAALRRLQQRGLAPLGSDQGLRVLLKSVNLGLQQFAVFSGQASSIRSMMKMSEVTSIPEEKKQKEQAKDKTETEANFSLLQARVLGYFQAELAQVLNLVPNRLSVDSPLERYGMDSILAMDLISHLEQRFGPLSKTLFFEVQTVKALSQYFIEHHRDVLLEVLGEKLPPIKVSKEGTGESEQKFNLKQVRSIKRGVRRSGFSNASWSTVQEKKQVAIIGLSGRYPQAQTLDQFWNNLCAGKDCISEIPAERWNYREHFDPNKNTPGKSYSKWGGFIDGMDEFDPLFFNISPREAEIIDPQERLFLQCVYHTLEDAGYTRTSISPRGEMSDRPANVGVFVGVMYEEYQLYAAQAQAFGWNLGVPGNVSSIANRVSYWCNFHGPSMAVDTMCSSSLTAIHLAVQHLRNGSCDAAVAGGVNLSIHPNKYLVLSQGKFASSKGKCESFGEGGDGYVPGEGIGAVLLKPLTQAERDGDHIYALIKSTAVNHGGKTNGYTVPNPLAQSEVIGQALKEAKIDPRTISYIEAHGTGTALGDPIEITGLSKAFATHSKSQALGYCAIGSVKSNIGHLESAAGIAGLTKILLQMKHRQLVASLHSTRLNPNIDFAKTPFVVQRKLSTWEKPYLNIEGVTKTYPRRAGISSFGAGGSNAHIILEEYESPVRERAPEETTPPLIIILSAKTRAQIIEQARNLLAYVEDHAPKAGDLRDLCYTLQVGREALDERAASRIHDVSSLKEKLQQLIMGADDASGVGHWYCTPVSKSADNISLFLEDTELSEAIDKWIVKGKYDNLLEFWVKGFTFDWQRLYENTNKPKRISLPLYPFVKNKYWLDIPQIAATNRAVVENGLKRLHPLLHENTSTSFDTRFTSQFDGTEFFFKDHQVRNRGVLPGAAHIEMARFALIKALDLDEDSAIQISDLTWLRPAILDSAGNTPLTLHISVEPTSEFAAEFYIYSSSDDGSELIYSRGRGQFFVVDNRQGMDLEEIKKTCVNAVEGETVYTLFAQGELNYGPTHRRIMRLKTGVDVNQRPQVLAELSLTSELKDDAYVLHPGLLDSVLQSTIGLSLRANGALSSTAAVSLPFNLASLKIYQPLPDKLFAWVRSSENSPTGERVQQVDIRVCNEKGLVCFEIERLSTRAINGEFKPPSPLITADAPAPLQALLPMWEIIAEDTEANLPSFANTVIVGCDGSSLDYHTDNTAERLSAIIPASKRVSLSNCSNQEKFCAALDESHKNIDRLIWILPQETTESVTDDVLISAQAQGVIGGLDLIKTLLTLGYADRQLHIHVISWQTQSINQIPHYPAHSSVQGFIGSVAKEHPRWTVQTVDLPLTADIELLKKSLTLSPAVYGEGLAYRRGQWYQQLLVPARLPVLAEETLYRHRGVYLVIGGAGGLGEVWSETLIKDYQAQVVWVGRRPLDKAIERKISRLEDFGPAPFYVQADATNRESLEKAKHLIKTRFGKIHGLVHSALVLKDKSIRNMDAQRFKASLTAKVDISVRMAQVFSDERLDFVLFFSSLQSFTKSAGQSNYAAGCTFKDAFGLRLAQVLSCPVKIINWGYWGSVGVVADEAQRKRMAAMGIGSIEPSEGMDFLEQFLNTPVAQLGAVK